MCLDRDLERGDLGIEVADHRLDPRLHPRFMGHRQAALFGLAHVHHLAPAGGEFAQGVVALHGLAEGVAVSFQRRALGQQTGVLAVGLGRDPEIAAERHS